MKRLFYISIILFSVAGFCEAQNILYTKLISAISAKAGEDLGNKLIAVNVWSTHVPETRKINTEFEKSATVYQYAKLKGGPHGFVAVAFAIDKDKVLINVTLQKDGIQKMITLSTDDSELSKLLSEKPIGYNVIFDNKGNSVYENLKEGTVFDSVHQLITR